MSDYFDSKHLELYIPDVKPDLMKEISKLSNDEIMRCIYSWSKYLRDRQTELPGVDILENLWKKCLKSDDVHRFYGISYIYYQMCAMVAESASVEYLNNVEDESDID